MTSKRDLYRLTGTDDVTSGVPDRYLKLAGGDELPSAKELSQEQFQEAVERIFEDTSNYPRFPWKALDDLSGPLCPEDLVIIAARTGGGKSLFLQNHFDALIRAGRYGLYVGLEQTPKVLRIKWACLANDIPPKLLLAPQPGEQGSPQWNTAVKLVQEHLAWQKTPEIMARAHFSNARKIDAKGLREWTEWAVDRGAEFVIVDHIDRVNHGDGRNSFHEMSETVRLAKELAAKHRIVMMLASQVGRPHDALEKFMPPSLHELRGGGTKEEEADTVIGVYRPMRADVTDKEMKLVRQGLADVSSVIEPNVMGVMVLKHRLDGPVAGKVIKLAVKHQKVTDMPERDRWSTEGGYAREVV